MILKKLRKRKIGKKKMAKITADGNKLIECGEEIVSLSNKYNELIEDLFIKLSKIPSTAWSGDSANGYVSRIMRDKTTYITFGNGLKTYGNVIKNTGNNINYIIKKWNDK